MNTFPGKSTISAQTSAAGANSCKQEAGLKDVASFHNLHESYKKAACGKRKRHDVAVFSMKWESRLLRLQSMLLNKTYRPGRYRIFKVFEKKTRNIMAAPFIDRIVHHAVCNLMAPIMEKKLHPHACANRPGRGTSFGVNLFAKYMHRYPYVLKCDIKNFFQSIDRAILFDKLRNTLCKKILAWNRGLGDSVRSSSWGLLEQQQEQHALR